MLIRAIRVCLLPVFPPSLLFPQLSPVTALRPFNVRCWMLKLKWEGDVSMGQVSASQQFQLLFSGSEGLLGVVYPAVLAVHDILTERK